MEWHTLMSIGSLMKGFLLKMSLCQQHYTHLAVHQHLTFCLYFILPMQHHNVFGLLWCYSDKLPKIDKENFSTFRPEGLHQERAFVRRVPLTLLTKALRSKRREVFFVYFRQLKNWLCCYYIKTLPRCTLVILYCTITVCSKFNIHCIILFPRLMF